ncbi:MAG: PPC domain-containing protein, partial [Planctomycetes bacterium]|nr:PPC domain-containing protein [Planctomycetota bacterium]
MARFLAVAALAFLTAAHLTPVISKEKDKEKDKEFRVQGKLGKDDPKDDGRQGPKQVHTIPMKAGKIYTIDMVSTEFDSYLRLLDAKGNQLEEDDDSGGMLNARIIFNCPKDGDYKIVTTTFGPNMMGAYTLTAKTSGTAVQASTAHSAMIGKAAPDFAADFAINGKAGKLSDLKG